MNGRKRSTLTRQTTEDPLFLSVINKAVPGVSKDETAGYPIKSFIGLRSKVGSKSN